VTAALAAAVLCTAGLAGLYRLLVPARPPLAAELARLLDPTPSPALARGGQSRLITQLSTSVQHHGWVTTTVSGNLLVCEQSLDQLVGRCLAAGTSLGAVGITLTVGLTLSGLTLSLPVVMLAGVLGVLAGVVLPPYLLRDQAQARRDQVRAALPGLLDLTGVLLAAGNSLEAAIRTAAAAHQDWTHQQLQHALHAAALSRQPAADALDQLGRRLGVAELTQLADGLAMAEREGAAMRESLAARARSLRERHLAAVEAKAGSATEGMSFPLVAFVFGFIVLIGYPAIVGLSAGLGSS
jgi:Flp pilus assembly protein TadB